MAIAWSKTREAFPLNEKKILKKTLTGALAILFLTLIGVGVSVAVDKNMDAPTWLPWAVGGGLALALLWIVLLYRFQRWYFEVYFYDLTDDYVVIRKGPITPHEITIPYERIQDVYVDQDIFDRFFGLYDVHLSSATASSSLEAHIDGVGKEGMEGLRAALLETVKTRISKAKRA